MTSALSKGIPERFSKDSFRKYFCGFLRSSHSHRDSIEYSRFVQRFFLDFIQWLQPDFFFRDSCRNSSRDSCRNLSDLYARIFSEFIRIFFPEIFFRNLCKNYFRCFLELFTEFYPYVSPNLSLGIISDIRSLIPLENNQIILKGISPEKN